MKTPDFRYFAQTDLDQVLSLDRFGRYLQWAAGKPEQALRLYALNTVLSEALYTPLHLLEIALRNRIHSVLTAMSPTWYDDPRLVQHSYQQDNIRKVKENLRKTKISFTSGDVIASLTFGFWGAMLNHEQEALWRRSLHKIAIDEQGRFLKRRQLADPLSRIRKLRNRIAHHEPILHWDLPRHYAEMLTVTGWLSTTAAMWSNACSRFQKVYADQGILLQGKLCC